MTNMNLIIRFWKIIDSGEFALLGEVCSEKVRVLLRNTDEVFDGLKEYIDFNMSYPGKWNASIECLYDVNSGVISIVKISNAEGRNYYVVSVFSITAGLITDIREYWGENTEIPQWRSDIKLKQ